MEGRKRDKDAESQEWKRAEIEGLRERDEEANIPLSALSPISYGLRCGKKYDPKRRCRKSH